MRFARARSSVEVAIGRPGIDPCIDLQECHPDSFDIGVGDGPKAAMGIAVFGANAGVHDEGSDGWNGEDALGDQCLAAGNHQVRFSIANESFRFPRVGAGRNQFGGPEASDIWRKAPRPAVVPTLDPSRQRKTGSIRERRRRPKNGASPHAELPGEGASFSAHEFRGERPRPEVRKTKPSRRPARRGLTHLLHGRSVVSASAGPNVIRFTFPLPLSA